MEIIEVPIEKLNYNRNCLRIFLKENDDMFKCLITSIITFGLQFPLLINNEYEIIAGNQILNVLKFLNWEKVPCIITTISKDKELDLSIVLNKIRGDWNILRLIEYFGKRNYSEKELKAIGWNKLEVDSLLPINKLPDLEQSKLQENKQGNLF